MYQLTNSALVASSTCSVANAVRLFTLSQLFGTGGAVGARLHKPHDDNTKEVKSGALGGHDTEPTRPIYLPA